MSQCKEQSLNGEAPTAAHLSPFEDGRSVKDVTADDILLGSRADEIGDHVGPVAENLQQARLLAALWVLPACLLLVKTVPDQATPCSGNHLTWPTPPIQVNT